MNSTTVSGAKAELADAISFGQIAIQGAVGTSGYQALADAIQQGQETLQWINDNENLTPPSLDDSPRVRDMIANAIEAITASAANVKTSPDAPLFKTMFPAASTLSWGWIAGGAALLVGFALLFHEGGGRRRRV